MEMTGLGMADFCRLIESLRVLKKSEKISKKICIHKSTTEMRKTKIYHLVTFWWAINVILLGWECPQRSFIHFC